MPRAPLSTDPAVVRRRLRKRARKQDADIDTLKDALRKPIEEWDFEELAHGRPRSKNGTFSGMSPKWISPLVAAEAKKRLQEHTVFELSKYAGHAIQVIHDLMMSDTRDEFGRPIVDTRTRLQAAQFVIEHVIGKPKVRVDIQANQVQALLASALVLPDGTPAHPVIEGSYEEPGDGEADLPE